MFKQYGKFDNPGGPRREYTPTGNHDVTLGKIEAKIGRKSGLNTVIIEYAIGDEDNYVQVYSLKNKWIAQTAASFFAALVGLDLETAQATPAEDLAAALGIPLPGGIEPDDDAVELVSKLACSEAQPFEGTAMRLEAWKTETKAGDAFTATAWYMAH